MIKVSFIGRLGNNMIQYSLARFLAETKGYSMEYGTIGGTGVHHMFSVFPSTVETIVGESIYSNELIVGYGSKDNYIQHYDLQQLQEHVGKITLTGFFQKHEFFMNNLDRIRSYFKYDTTNLIPCTYDVVIHIRLGDYVQLNHFIHPSKYYKLYKELGVKNALILTDDVDSVYLEDFRKDNTCKIEQNSIAQDLHYMITAKSIVVSQSTFSWWGAYLGDKDSIYVPYDNTQEYPWKLKPGMDDIDLVPINSPYKKIICS